MFRVEKKSRVTGRKSILVIEATDAGLKHLRLWSQSISEDPVTICLNGEEFSFTTSAERTCLIEGYLAGYRLACEQFRKTVLESLQFVSDDPGPGLLDSAEEEVEEDDITADLHKPAIKDEDLLSGDLLLEDDD